MDRNRRGRDQPDLVAGAGDVIFQIADAIAAQIADARLAARAKRQHVRTNFFQLGPASLQRPDFDDQRVDVRIALRRIQRIDEIMLHGNKFPANRREKIHRPLLIDFTADFEQQHRIRSHPRRLRRHDDQNHHRHNHKNNHKRPPLTPCHDKPLQKYESELRNKIAPGGKNSNRAESASLARRRLDRVGPRGLHFVSSRAFWWKPRIYAGGA